MLNPKNGNYYGIRLGEDQKSLIKIVTSPIKTNRKVEEIVTIYPTNSIKVEKAYKTWLWDLKPKSSVMAVWSYTWDWIVF